MAWTDSFPSVARVGEGAERAWRLPVGAASPLWLAFGAAASAGVAWWWLTRWTRAASVEAFAPRPRLPFAEPAEPAPPPIAAPAAPAEIPASNRDPAELELIADDAAADDLTRLVGIGPKLAQALAASGVTRYVQIAAWTDADLAAFDAALGLKGRPVRDGWVAQAKKLAKRR